MIAMPAPIKRLFEWKVRAVRCAFSISPWEANDES